MSKSLGNVIDPFTLAEHYGVDPLRYFFLREVPFGQDGNYSHEAIVSRINADLANDLGNLAQRSLSMVNKNLGGHAPDYGTLLPQDEAMLAQAYALPEKARASMQNFALHLMLGEIWKVVADANRYFANEQPWIVRKTDEARFATILAVTLETIRCIAIMAQPVMPTAMAKMLDALAVNGDARSFAAVTSAHHIKGGTLLPAPSPVFPRYVEEDKENGA